MTQVYSQDAIGLAISNVVRQVAFLRANVKDCVLVRRPEGVLVHTRLQAMFNMKFSSHLEQSIHEIIVSHGHAAERLGPGGFDLCIEKLLEKLDVSDMGNHCLPATIIPSDMIGPGVAAATEPDVAWVLAEHLAGASQRTSTMLMSALELAGFAGRIMVEKTTAKPSVELVRGYSFDQSPVWPMSVRLEKPRIVCIDGFIESVSELHHLLEESSVAKEPLLVFVRGMSDDVKNTLRVNYDRGSLRVVPIIVKFDVQGINAINDIAVATGSHLVSSHAGDLISNVKLTDASRIDEAIVYPTKVVLTHAGSYRAVASHVEFLRKKRLDEKIDDVAQLFDLRIKSLSPNHVVIRLTDDKDYVTASQAIDYALRAVKALVDYGTIAIDGRKVLTVAATASEVHASRCCATLRSLGAMVS